MSTFEDAAGKMNRELLGRLLFNRLGSKREEVVTGPGYGVDTAVIDLGGGRGLAVSSDPLSLIPPLGLRESAWLSVHLLANDMATTGFAPDYAQFVLNLPSDLSSEDFDTYWGCVSEFCEEIGVAITGGHTGKVKGQTSTLPGGGTMFLAAPLDQIVTSDGADSGDRIVVTKEAALVSSSILARSFPNRVGERLGEELYRQVHESFYRTSSLEDALAASDVLENRVELKAMHDVTEGGILGAILEMAEASGCGFLLEADRLPVGEAQRQIGELFEIDPLYCVGAGSMIMAVKPGVEEKLIEHLHARSIDAAVVGEMRSREDDFRMVEDGLEHTVSFDGRDPYWAAFYKAMEAGWS